MHDGGNEIIVQKEKSVKKTMLCAIYKTVIMIGWLFLFIQHAITNDGGIINSIWGGVCGFFSGYQIAETIKWWTNFKIARKELKAMIEEEEKAIIDAEATQEV